MAMTPREATKQLLADIVLSGPVREDVYKATLGKEFLSGLQEGTFYKDFISEYAGMTTEEREFIINEMYCVRNCIFHASISYLNDDGVLYLLEGENECPIVNKPHTRRFHGNVRATSDELQVIVSRSRGFVFSSIIEVYKEKLDSIIKAEVPKEHMEFVWRKGTREVESMFRGVTFRSVSVDASEKTGVDERCGPFGSVTLNHTSKRDRQSGYEDSVIDSIKTHPRFRLRK